MSTRSRPVHLVPLLAGGALAALIGAGGASAQSERALAEVGHHPAGAPEWALGLLARSDELNRIHGLGRPAPRRECADVPVRDRAARGAVRNAEDTP